MVSYRNVVKRALAFGPGAASAVWVALCIGLTFLAVKTPWSPLPQPVIAASGLVASAALWFRTGHPVAVTAVTGLGYALSGNPGPLLISLFSSANARVGTRFLVLAAIGVAGFLAPDVVWQLSGENQAWVDAVRDAVAATGVTMAAGGYAASRRELTASLRERAERAEAEQRLRNQQARTAERARIAREMHDVLAHKVALISLHAGGLEVNPGADPSRIESEAALIRATAQQAQHELRKILGLLRADPIEEHPDLRKLVDSWEAAGNTVTLENEVDVLPAPMARAAYRLVQEGLTNAHRHAPGAPVTVSVSASTSASASASGGAHDGVTIAVVNLPATRAAGPLAGSGVGSGVGLVGLSERFQLIGGTVRGGPEDGGGWRLEGHLPWPLDGAAAFAGESHDQDVGGGR
ncbi:hypothetical protein J5X84_04275 [Streptosporangiaceae bacterium NEAU-GS5]|nr:hypothetical protein [Streptosporangiaceae bacterium NEAU-GS5]